MIAGRAAAFVHAAVAVGVGLALAAAAGYSMSLQRHRYQSALRDQTVQHAAALRAKLESELSASVFLAQGIVAYLNARAPLQGLPDDAGMRRALGSLYSAGRHIRNIAMAPGNRVAMVYPQAGNESVLGLDYAQTPAQWPTVQRAMETRRPVLAGPVALVQGGRGLIMRTPVFLEQGGYWGMVSVVVDLDAFLRASGLQDAQFDAVLRGSDGQGTRGALISGEAEVFSRDPVRMTLLVPGGSWELAVVPAGGWQVLPPLLIALPYVGYAAAALLSLLLWLALRGQSRAHQAQAAMQQLIAQLGSANHELEQLSETDPLTGVRNRRGLDEVLPAEWRRCRRHDAPLAVLMIDVDLFKAYNDAHGHLRGDECLKRVALAMQGTAVRSGDALARSGGEEFVMVLPDADIAAAMTQAERVRAAVEDERILHGHSPVSPYVTVSIGVAAEVARTPTGYAGLLEAADGALYAAKRSGRNCVRASEPPAGTASARTA